jgi:hypothetical protein
MQIMSRDGASRAALLTCHAVAHSSPHCVTRLGKAQQRLGLLCRTATTQSLHNSSASPGLKCSCQPIKFTAQAPSGRSNRPVYAAATAAAEDVAFLAAAVACFLRSAASATCAALRPDASIAPKVGPMRGEPST